MKRTSLGMLGIVVLASAGASAQMQTAAVTPAWVQNDATKDTGQGVFLKSASGCFLYTASHVLAPEGDRADTASFRIRGSEPAAGKVRWTAPEVAGGFDIGVIEPGSDAPSACPDIPTAARIDQALDSGQGEVLLIGRGGDRTRIAVRIVRAEPRILVRPLSNLDQIQKGDSGAPLLVDGIVVGLVSSVDNTGGEAQINVTRFDAAPAEARASFAPPTAVAAPITDNMADSVCGGKVTGVPRGVTLPIGGIDALLTKGNGDCLIADAGRSIALEIQMCPGAEARPISLITLDRGSQAVSGGNTKSRPLVTVSAAGEKQGFRPIGTGKSFGDVSIQPGALRGVSKLRIEIPGSPGYQEGLCSVSVR